MVELLQAPDQVAAFRITGKLTGEEFDTIAALIEEKLGRHEKVALYADMIGLTDVTGDAIVKRVRYGMGKLGELHRFPRVAIITDKEWLRALAGFSADFAKWMEVRTFEGTERDAAMAWSSRPF